MHFVYMQMCDWIRLGVNEVRVGTCLSVCWKM